jgi:hypothetical protein
MGTGEKAAEPSGAPTDAQAISTGQPSTTSFRWTRRPRTRSRRPPLRYRSRRRTTSSSHQSCCSRWCYQTCSTNSFPPCWPTTNSCRPWWTSSPAARCTPSSWRPPRDSKCRRCRRDPSSSCRRGPRRSRCCRSCARTANLRPGYRTRATRRSRRRRSRSRRSTESRIGSTSGESRLRLPWKRFASGGAYHQAFFLSIASTKRPT